MEAARHTPGPWHVDVHTNVMAPGGLVAFPGISAGFDQVANARLIAAAPEMLEALQWIAANGPEVGWGVRARALGAIAKATGGAS